MWSALNFSQFFQCTAEDAPTDESEEEKKMEARSAKVIEIIGKTLYIKVTK